MHRLSQGFLNYGSRPHLRSPNVILRSGTNRLGKSDIRVFVVFAKKVESRPDVNAISTTLLGAITCFMLSDVY